MEAKEKLTFMICVTIIIITTIVSIGYYSINDRKLMATNITDAVAKGMDPLSVRCSYATSADVVCVAYASANKK